jgi:chromate reductase, NAD(P)H dehydrogenase (quinone)
MQKVLAISGSTRKNSGNISVIQTLEQLFSDRMKLFLYQTIDQLPHFNPDLDEDDPPVAVMELRQMIKDADAVIICTPEYVFSLPGSLKNAIEWTVSTTIFQYKPVVLIVAAASGQKAMESLHLILTTLEARIEDDSQLIIQGIRGKMDSEGNIVHQETIERIRRLGESLLLQLKS